MDAIFLAFFFAIAAALLIECVKALWSRWRQSRRRVACPSRPRPRFRSARRPARAL
jgi:hypothetical protein